MDTVRTQIGGTAPDTGPGPGWLGLALDLQPLAALLVDVSTGLIVVANQAAQKAGLMAGTHPQGDWQTAQAGIVPTSDGHLAQGFIEGAGRAEGVEITWRSTDRELHYRVFARAVPPEAGVSFVVVTLLDITIQKQTEAELRKAVEVRDEFFSVATHELKDPLFALQLSLQLLKRSSQQAGEAAPIILQHLDVSARQADRLARLIENLLDVSRILNEKIYLDIEAIDLHDLVREVIGRFDDRARETTTPIELESGAPVIAHVDRIKIEQVVSNLLVNALKYGSGQPVTVRVRGVGDNAVLEVADRGPGVALEDQERIFQRFERASGQHAQHSLGLGLYIVRSWVEAHGGSVTLVSQPDAGAVFTVTLPRTRLQGAGRSRPASGD